MKVKFLYFDLKQSVEYYSKLKSSHFINSLLVSSEFRRALNLYEIVYNREIKIESLLLYKINKRQYNFKIISRDFHSYIRSLKPVIINSNVKSEYSFYRDFISIDLLNGLVYIPLDVEVDLFNIKDVERIRSDLAK